jgi:hypothetical protein
MEDYKKLPYILGASSNLVGFCFVTLNSIKIPDLKNETLIENITTFSFLAFIMSGIFSFLPIRTHKGCGVFLIQWLNMRLSRNYCLFCYCRIN